jgi:hypothetical protein
MKQNPQNKTEFVFRNRKAACKQMMSTSVKTVSEFKQNSCKVLLLRLHR